MTWTWALVPIILLGLLLIFGSVIGAIWARTEYPLPDDRPVWVRVRAAYWRHVRGRRSP